MDALLLDWRGQLPVAGVLRLDQQWGGEGGDQEKKKTTMMHFGLASFLPSFLLTVLGLFPPPALLYPLRSLKANPFQSDDHSSGPRPVQSVRVVGGGNGKCNGWKWNDDGGGGGCRRGDWRHGEGGRRATEGSAQI